MTSNQNLLTVEGLSEVLQVPKSWIYERTRTGKIPCVKIGKYVRFDLEEIKKWLNKDSSSNQQVQLLRTP